MRHSQGHRLATDEPRQHHYEFAHVVLRAIAFRLDAGLLDIAAAGRLTGELRRTWDRVGEGLPPERRLPADGLDAGVHDTDALTAAVVALPRAEHIAEAHLAAFVAPKHDPGAVPGYFLLEHSWTVDDEPTTRLTRWTRDGRHLDLGDGTPPDPAAFLAAVARVLTIGT